MQFCIAKRVSSAPAQARADCLVFGVGCPPQSLDRSAVVTQSDLTSAAPPFRHIPQSTYRGTMQRMNANLGFFLVNQETAVATLKNLDLAAIPRVGEFVKIPSKSDQTYRVTNVGWVYPSDSTTIKVGIEIEPLGGSSNLVSE